MKTPPTSSELSPMWRRYWQALAQRGRQLRGSSTTSGRPPTGEPRNRLSTAKQAVRRAAGAAGRQVAVVDPHIDRFVIAQAGEKKVLELHKHWIVMVWPTI